jgi:hypothetical protein
MQYFPITSQPSLLSIAQDSGDALITAASFSSMNADFVLVNGLFQPQVCDKKRLGVNPALTCTSH